MSTIDRSDNMSFHDQDDPDSTSMHSQNNVLNHNMVEIAGRTESGNTGRRTPVAEDVDSMDVDLAYEQADFFDAIQDKIRIGTVNRSDLRQLYSVLSEFRGGTMRGIWIRQIAEVVASTSSMSVDEVSDALTVPTRILEFVNGGKIIEGIRARNATNSDAVNHRCSLVNSVLTSGSQETRESTVMKASIADDTTKVLETVRSDHIVTDSRVNQESVVIEPFSTNARLPQSELNNMFPMLNFVSALDYFAWKNELIKKFNQPEFVKINRFEVVMSRLDAHNRTILASQQLERNYNLVFDKLDGLYKVAAETEIIGNLSGFRKIQKETTLNMLMRFEKAYLLAIDLKCENKYLTAGFEAFMNVLSLSDILAYLELQKLLDQHSLLKALNILNNKLFKNSSQNIQVAANAPKRERPMETGFMGRSRPSAGVNCYRCGMPGHIIETCRTVLDLSNRCAVCGSDSHRTARCNQLGTRKCTKCPGNHYYSMCPNHPANLISRMPDPVVDVDQTRRPIAETATINQES